VPRILIEAPGACGQGYKDAAELMLANGANDFHSALRYARLGGHKDLIKLITDKLAEAH
jgi:hypothetical protein